ncbi:hypothetical protein FAES_1556 [Fibrella aestuarina BUZ 2]|uniref:Ferritin-like domain-containing protein n=1 Tax=Fibrella aestuarina BUZ 2 TaxID=1166018 RepID=I0K613_9BACT|nr:ferritin-like domain-containing protein [Fibrella aestuarina]CCG99566.1 hypothetical protein FAES_1556 [Fibrella aestuarina BUZ 2]
MNLFQLFSDIEKVDAEANERLQHSRRNLLKKTFAAAAVGTPTLLAASMNKAFGQSNIIVDVLNFALTLEYLERDFYRAGLFSGIVPGADRDGIVTITKHEAQHVDFLNAALGSAAIPKPAKYDFTAGGAFPTVLTNYQTFLTVANALEDTGVRAYKGQAANLMSNKDVLTAALRIHSVEARHVAGIRRLRGIDYVYSSDVFPMGVPTAVYQNESQYNQAGVDLLQVADAKIIPRATPRVAEKAQVVFESFDEPLTKEQVLAIAGPFLPK